MTRSARSDNLPIRHLQRPASAAFTVSITSEVGLGYFWMKKKKITFRIAIGLIGEQMKRGKIRKSHK